MSDFYKDRNILVTGGTGLIGQPLVEMLLKQSARVRVVSLDDSRLAPAGVEFIRGDLTHWEVCQKAVQGMDFVFHLAGIKGSPLMAAKKPASFFVPTILFNTNMMEASRRAGVKRYLFTSTIGVYAPAEIFHEDDVWETFPSENDRFAGWAKRMGELQAEAYRIEYGWEGVAIVRPANVYGPYDNFDSENAMVIPSLIRRAMDGENPLRVWGDGSPIRDFIYARDVARGMLLILEKLPGVPVNLGSGKGVSIKEIVEIIAKNLPERPEIVWDTSWPSGDKIRLIDTTRARSLLGFESEIGIEDGIRGTLEWYREHGDEAEKRFNVFKEGKLVLGN